MFRTIQKLTTIQKLALVAAVLVVAATIYAIIDGKLANLLIAAALGTSMLAGFAWLMEKRLGDAYDTGGDARQRALLGRMGMQQQDRD